MTARVKSVPQRKLHLLVNGEPYHLHVEDHRSLGEVLREDLGLTGTKIACNQAACGACTVLLNGRAIFACHTLAAQAENSLIITIEGLNDRDRLHPLQTAFISHDALQCGFCTPGMIMALIAAIDAGVAADRGALASAISGNICRCGAYQHILDAALSVMAR